MQTASTCKANDTIRLRAASRTPANYCIPSLFLKWILDYDASPTGIEDVLVSHCQMTGSFKGTR